MLTYQRSECPNGVCPSHLYEEFARNISGFKPIIDMDNALFVTKIDPIPQVAQYSAATAAAAAPVQVTSDEIVCCKTSWLARWSVPERLSQCAATAG